MERTADDALADNIKAMGQDLGELYSALWQEVAWIHAKWAEYVELFGASESRIDLLNRAAPRFARLIQDSLWEDTLLHIARLTDPPKSGRKRKSTLTMLALVQHISDATFRTQIKRLVSELLSRAEFCRDWRDRRLAHRDLLLALARGAQPLKLGSRKDVREVLEKLAEILNGISAHYLDSTTSFDLQTGAGGAVSMLYVIDDGIRADDERRARLKSGNVRADDYGPRKI